MGCFLFRPSVPPRMRKHSKQKSTCSAGGADFEPCSPGVVREVLMLDFLWDKD